jgi:hypothetical protein
VAGESGIKIKPRMKEMVRSAKERYPNLTASDIAKITGLRPAYVRTALARADGKRLD